ncbi:fungal-specific transcription factor domain-containing protein [Mycena albidolilacea]|uniref:Fungal-specific transcription factor domain-containing protein n=1 Tax=Mycena albidolilacea TaxID=1033008 RepID=A0AAD7A3A0_9AGAR|nr:fungal-specific transcription factor domain-containing protein [Mycena albidolilacea]
MIGPSASFYDPDQHQQQRGSYQQFDFAYPAPVAYDQLLVQLYSQQQQSRQQPQQAQHVRYPAYPPAQSISDPNPNPNYNIHHNDSEDGFGFSGGGEAGISVGIGGLGVRSKGARLPGACTHCKKLKMKCDFGPGGSGSPGTGDPADNTCRRCRAGGHVCIVEERKPRSAPNKREYLLAQIWQKNQVIESLLKQLHNPYIATPLSIASYRMATSPSDATNRNNLTWLDRLQASVRAGSGDISATNFAFSASASLSGAKRNPNFVSPSFNSTNPNLASNPAFEESDEVEAGNEGEGEEEDGGDASVPLRLIANLSLSNSRERRRFRGESATREEELDDLDDDNVGVANAAYFMPGPATDLGMRAQLIEQHSPPEILIHGLVVPEDVDKLFEIFYTRVNPFIALLDPVLHTPASTFARCPFLFTVVCAISSRYYPEKSEIYPIAMHFAKQPAANALIDGWKSVELVQAYILMSIYGVPARKWEEDRSWLYSGLAIRLATDLNLHQVPSNKDKGKERQEREQLNRTRVWMICFNLDRTMATQFGKPPTIKEDYILRHGNEDWYKKSPYNTTYDLHMCAYTALLRVFARFYDEIFSDPTSPSGLNKRIDFRSVTIAHDVKLTAFMEEWSKRFAEDSDANDRKCAVRVKFLPFLVAYSRLVMFSFGFQQAYQRGLQSADHIFFTKCLESAKAVLRIMVEGLVPTAFMRYSPDGHFIITAFASAFLLKLLRPEFSHLVPKEEDHLVYDLIGRLIQTLSSPEVAIDDRHTPKLYARFLAGLLSGHRRDGATVGRLHPQPPTQQSVSGSSSSEYGHHSCASSMFTMSPLAGVGAALGPEHGSQGYQHSYAQPETVATPIYRPEATCSGPIQYGTEMDLETGLSDEEQMLAAMQALRQPTFWTNMMLPGFSWPGSSDHSPASNASNASSGSPSVCQPQQLMGMQGLPGPAFNDGFHHQLEVPQFAAR